MADRFEYSGTAVEAKLSGSITASSMSMTLDTVTGWPTGVIGNFRAVIDPGLSTEEEVRCSSRSGTNITIVERGAGGTTAVAHNIGAVVQHVFTAADADAANRHAADTGIDDHTQYMHVSTPRTVSAPHNYTGNQTHSGTETFNGPVNLNGPVSLAQPASTPMGTAADLKPVGTGTADPGTSTRSMRADARLSVDQVAIERAVWKAGDYKLTGITGAITSEWLECNGQAVSRTQYPALFSAIGTSYGAGNGTSTFNVPDFRDVMISGAGTGGQRSIGASGGADQQTLSVNQLPAHTHPVSDPGHGHNINDPQHQHRADGQAGNRWLITVEDSTIRQANDYPNGQSISYTDIDPASTGITIQPSGTGISVGNTGGGQPVSTVPKWRGARVLIKAH